MTAPAKLEPKRADDHSSAYCKFASTQELFHFYLLREVESNMLTGAANQRHIDGIHHPGTTAPTATATRSPQPEVSGRARKSWGNKIRQFTFDKLKQLFTSRHSDNAGPSPKARATVSAAVGTAKAGLTRLDAQLKAAYRSARPATQESGTEGSNAPRQPRNAQTQEPLEHRFTDPRTGHAIAVKSWIDEQGRKWKISHDRTADIITTQTKTKWEQASNNADKMVRTVTTEDNDQKTRWKESLDVWTGKIERTTAKTKTKWEQDPNDRNKMVRTVTSEDADGKKNRWKETLDVLTGSIEQKPFSPVRSANTTVASTSASHWPAQSGIPPESSTRSRRQYPAGTGNSHRARSTDSDSTG